MTTTKTKVQRAVEHIFTHPGTRSTDLSPIFGCLPKDVPAYMKDVMKLGLLVTCKVELPNKVVAYEYRPSASAPSKAPDLRAWRASLTKAEPKPTATNAADTPSIAVRAVTTQAGSGDITPASVHSATIVDGGSKRAVPPPKGTEHVIEAAKRDEQPAAPASDNDPYRLIGEIRNALCLPIDVSNNAITTAIEEMVSVITDKDSQIDSRDAQIRNLSTQIEFLRDELDMHTKRGKTIHIAACPFCGFDDVEIDEVRIGEFAVDCPKCEAIGPIKPSEMEAISYWNDRRDA